MTKANKTKKKSKTPVSTKSVTDSKTKRKTRHKFRADYKDRGVDSFYEGITKLIDANEELGEDKPDFDFIGFSIGKSYRSLAHSLEMLCKEVLERVAPCLTYDNLNDFNKLIPKNDENATTCGALVALARATKVLKKKIENEEIGKLEGLIDERNLYEHRNFSIKNISVAINKIVESSEIVVGIYNAEFRDADLIAEVDKDKGHIKTKYEKIKTECSSEFKKVVSKINRMKQKDANLAVIVCKSCSCNTAILDAGGKKYRCEWCEDEREKVNCSIDSCKKLTWAVKSESSPLCKWHSWFRDIKDDSLKISFSTSYRIFDGDEVEDY